MTFVAWVVFVKAMFWCLNLKPNDGFLSYNMPELLNKTGHGLIDIVIAWDELSQFCTQSIFKNNEKNTYIYCVLEWNLRPSTMLALY